MSETAVGLFPNSGAAAAVVDALKEIGFSGDAIRTLTAPTSGAVDSATSTPQIDFEAALSRDLRSMGATDGDCEVYLDGLRRGNALVFATGTVRQVNLAIDLMDDFEAIEVEELVGAMPNLPSGNQGFSGAHSISAKEDRIRARTTGAKVFSW